MKIRLTPSLIRQALAILRELEQRGYTVKPTARGVWMRAYTSGPLSEWKSEWTPLPFGTGTNVT
ncbi:MAG: hypothetical protein A2W31_11435 [Planctomycetes bacterium RBG_16_64_10]|nr:MAG: hypothetical protein A2W31_11435 [Planctomycetes bacterium RBG_16_64_10]